MMKYFSLAVLLMLLAVPVSLAHEDEKSFDEVMNEIMLNQGVSTTSQISCGAVTDEQFEELGDAIMGKMAGSDNFHDQMDEMMGGEGSQSLTSMHAFMGKNWLGCTTAQNGMMGNSMMAPMMMRMMGSAYPAFYTRSDSIILAAAIGWILAIILAVYLYAKTVKRKGKKGGAGSTRK